MSSIRARKFALLEESKKLAFLRCLMAKMIAARSGYHVSWTAEDEEAAKAIIGDVFFLSDSAMSQSVNVQKIYPSVSSAKKAMVPGRERVEVLPYVYL